jgi:hypothetical protein
MWILKGTMLGLWLFGFGTLAFFYFTVYRHIPPNSMVAVTMITRHTTQSPLWWTALMVCLVLGYTIARSWAGPTVLWVGLFVTGLIPAGIFTIFITMIVKLKQAAQGHP